MVANDVEDPEEIENVPSALNQNSDAISSDPDAISSGRQQNPDAISSGTNINRNLDAISSLDQHTPMLLSRNLDLNDTVIFDQSQLSDDSEIVLRRRSAALLRSGRTEGTTRLENDDAISTSNSNQLDEEFQLSDSQNAELQALSNDLIRNYLKSVRKPAAVAPEFSYQVPRANAKEKTEITDVSMKEVKQVHRTARKDTTDLIIKGLTQNCILKGNNKRQQLRDMHTILQSTGLLTMLLEQRTVPVISETNPLGYTPARVIMVAK